MALSIGLKADEAKGGPGVARFLHRMACAGDEPRESITPEQTRLEPAARILNLTIASSPCDTPFHSSTTRTKASSALSKPSSALSKPSSALSKP